MRARMLVVTAGVSAPEDLDAQGSFGRVTGEFDEGLTLGLVQAVVQGAPPKTLAATSTPLPPFLHARMCAPARVGGRARYARRVPATSNGLPAREVRYPEGCDEHRCAGAKP